MEKRSYIWLCILLLSWLPAEAFSQEEKALTDSIHALDHFLEKGKLDMHVRTFMMGTINDKALTDYYAWAAGAGIGYESPYFSNFQFGFSGFFIFNLASDDLSKRDPLTGEANRYEKMLFNHHEPEERADLDRLEALFIRYHTGRFMLTLGRQKINTPLFNEQDNRMRPNIFSGIWTAYQWHLFTFYNGWITGISPRGTVDWYSINQSFGVYGMGKHWTGETGKYQGNINTEGILVNGISWKGCKHQQAKLWNYTKSIQAYSIAVL